MASDSRVSGSEDARKPDRIPDAAVDPKTNPQPPAERGATPKASAAAGEDRVRREGAVDKAPPTKTPAEPKPAAGVHSADVKPDAKTAPKPESQRESNPQPKKARSQKPVPPAVKADAASQPAEAAGTGTASAATPNATAGNGEVPPDDTSGDASGDREGMLGGVAANRFLLLNAVPSWLVSMVLHAALLMVLALLTLPERPPEQRIVAVANPNEVEEIEQLDQEEIDALDVQVFEGPAPADVMDVRTTTAEYDAPSLEDVSAAPEQIKLEDFGDMSALQDAMLDRMGGGNETGLGEVRGAKARRAMLERYGGSAGSEAAVAAALKWLAEHQLRDGGWDFDHTRGACQGRCGNPGVIPPARNGATAIALLPFLGAGQTHKEGKYKETVEQGLAFLIRSMKRSNNMGDLSDAGGRLYSHGLASIALCEAYAMTNDATLLQPAQLSLNFIIYAQDPIGGGWRYKPQQAGDTSVVGWQLMACKSGHMAYLKVPRQTFWGASKFLDFVQTDNGAKYGYTVPAEGPATSAVGLLCRMYLGWKQDNSSLKAGVEYLHKMGPSNNIYYDYYATQVMRHYGGPMWEEWNTKMRDQLVSSQDKKDHEAGSWYIRGPHTDKGGRLYCTAMATMILEVYYRHMPIYGQQAAEEEFPL